MARKSNYVDKCLKQIIKAITPIIQNELDRRGEGGVAQLKPLPPVEDLYYWSIGLKGKYGKKVIDLGIIDLYDLDHPSVDAEVTVKVRGTTPKLKKLLLQELENILKEFN